MKKFGYSVSAKNDIISASSVTDSFDQNENNYILNSGSVSIFKKDNEDWVDIQKVISWGHDINKLDEYGYSIDSTETYLVVGAPNHSYDENGNNYLINSGSVYVWKWNTETTSWEILQKLVSPNRGKYDQFGFNVKITNDVIVISSPFSDNTRDDILYEESGSVHVFRKKNNLDVWEFEKTIIPEGKNSLRKDQNFGKNISVHQNNNSIRLAVGDPGHGFDASGENYVENSGAVWVYKYSDAWALEQKIVAGDTNKDIVTKNARNKDDNFGFSLDIQNDLLIVGAINQDYDNLGNDYTENSGAAYLYKFDTSWKQIQKIAGATDGYIKYNNLFGYTVISNSNYIIVGAPQEGYDVNSLAHVENAGMLYLWKKDESGFTYIDHKDAGADRHEDLFVGKILSISDNTLFVGVPNYEYDANNENKLTKAGAIFVYNIIDDALVKSENKIFDPIRKENKKFGEVISSSGDYLVVGVPTDETNTSGEDVLPNAGAVYVYKKNENGIYEYKQKLITSERYENLKFGSSVDIENDTIIVGSPFYSSSTYTNLGKIWVFKLNTETNNWDQIDELIPSGKNRNTNDKFGIKFGTYGNYLAIGSPNHSYDSLEKNFKQNSGAVFIYEYVNSTWTLKQKLSASGINSRNENDNFGSMIYMVNDNLVVTAPNHGYDETGENYIENSGCVFVYKLTNDNWVLSQKIVPTGLNARNKDDNFGFSLDINENKMIVGSINHGFDANGENYISNAGAAWVYKKNTSGIWVQQQKITPQNNNERHENDNFGFSVTIEDNLCVVGTPKYKFVNGYDSKENAGAVWVFEELQENDEPILIEKKEKSLYTNKKVYVGNGSDTFVVPKNVNKLRVHLFGKDNINVGVGKSNANYVYDIYDVQENDQFIIDRDINGCTISNSSQLNLTYCISVNNTSGSSFCTENGIIYEAIPRDNANLILNSDDIEFNNDNIVTVIYDVENITQNPTLVSYENTKWVQQQCITSDGVDRKEDDNFGFSITSNSNYVAISAPNHGYSQVDKKFIKNSGAVYLYDYMKNTIKLEKGVIIEFNSILPYLVDTDFSFEILCKPYDVNEEHLLFNLKSIVKIVIKDKKIFGVINDKEVLIASLNQNYTKVDEYNSIIVRYSNTANKFEFIYNYETANILYEKVTITPELTEGYQETIVYNGEVKRIGFWNNIISQTIIDTLESNTIDKSNTNLIGFYVPTNITNNVLNDLSTKGNNANIIYVDDVENVQRDGIYTTIKQKITPSGLNSRIENDNFGYSISMTDDLLFVGAPNHGYDSNGENVILNSGSIWVFNKNKNNNNYWEQKQKINATGTNSRNENDNYGKVVLSTNEYLFVSSPNHGYDIAGENYIKNSGAIWVYSIIENEISFVNKIIASGINARNEDDNFGYTLAYGNNRLIVGTPNHGYDFDGNNYIKNAGAVWVFKLVDSSWVLEKKITPTGQNSRNENDNFGQSIAIDNGYIYVSSPNHSYDINGDNYVVNSGAIWSYKITDTDIVFDKKITNTTRELNQRFGENINIRNNNLIVTSINDELFTFNRENNEFAAKNISGLATLPSTKGGWAILINPQDNTIKNEITGENLVINGDVSLDDEFTLFGPKSIKMKSSDSKITINSIPSYMIRRTDTFSLEMWFMPRKRFLNENESNTSNMTLLLTSEQVNLPLFNIYLTPVNNRSNLMCYTNVSSNGVLNMSFSPTTVHYDEWNHYYLTKQDNFLILYINGQLIGKIYNESFFVMLNEKFYIGNNITNTTPFFGNIGLLRLNKNDVFDEANFIKYKNYIRYDENNRIGRGKSIHFVDDSKLLIGECYNNNTDYLLVDSKNRTGNVIGLSVDSNNNIIKNVDIIGKSIENINTFDRNDNDNYGYEVFLRNKELYVGSIGNKTHSKLNSFCVKDCGAVFKYKISSTNYVNFKEKIISPDRSVIGQHFGTSMEYKNESIYISAPDYKKEYYFEKNNYMYWALIHQSVYRFQNTPYYSPRYIMWDNNSVISDIDTKLSESYSVINLQGAIASSSKYPNEFTKKYDNTLQFIDISINNEIFSNNENYESDYYNTYNKIKSGGVIKIKENKFLTNILNPGTDKTQDNNYNFGWDIKIQNNNIFVGCPGNSWNVSGRENVPNAGSIYFHEYNDFHKQWYLKQNIQNSRIENFKFGGKIDTKNNNLITYGFNEISKSNYVYLLNKNDISSEYENVFSYEIQNGNNIDGISVRLVSDTDFVVGVPYLEKQDTHGIKIGAIEIFSKKQDKPWDMTQIYYGADLTHVAPEKAFVQTRTPNDWFGYRVKLNNNKLIVLAPNHYLNQDGEDSYWNTLFAYDIDATTSYATLKSMTNMLTEKPKGNISSQNTITFDTINYKNNLLIASSNNYDNTGLVKIYTDNNYAFTSNRSFVGPQDISYAKSSTILNDSLFVISANRQKYLSNNIGATIHVTLDGNVWNQKTWRFLPAISNNRLNKSGVDYDTIFINGRNKNETFGNIIKMDDDILVVGNPTGKSLSNGFVDPKGMGTCAIYINNSNVFDYNTKINSSKSFKSLKHFGISVDFKNNTLSTITRKSGMGSLNEARNECYSEIFEISEKNNVHTKWTSRNMATKQVSWKNTCILDNNNIYFGYPYANGNSIATNGILEYTEKVNDSWSGFKTRYQPGLTNSRNVYDQFGFNVSLGNNRLVVGVPNHKFNSSGTSKSVYGSAFVYDFDDIEWVFNSKLQSNKSATSLNFGNYVNINNKTVSVSSLNGTNGYIEIFKETGNKTWQNVFQKEGNKDLDYFATTSVLLDEDTLVIGSKQLSTNTFGVRKTGVYETIFNSTQDNTWLNEKGPIDDIYYTQGLIDIDNIIRYDGYNSVRSIDAYFGRSVDVYKNEIIVGSPSDKSTITGKPTIGGSIFRHKIVNNKVMLKEKITNPLNSNTIGFGYKIKSNDKYVTVGAPTLKTTDGASFIFKRNEDNTLSLSMVNTIPGSCGTDITYDNNKIVMSSPTCDGIPKISKSGVFSTLVEENNTWVYKGNIDKIYYIDANFEMGGSYSRASNPKRGGAGGSVYKSDYSTNGYSVIPQDGIYINAMDKNAVKTDDPNYVSGRGGQGQHGAVVIIDNTGETNTFTSSSSTYTVPSGVTEITTKLWGAGGGNGTTNIGTTTLFYGNAGNYAEATFPVSEGMIFNIRVGTYGYTDSSTAGTPYGGSGYYISTSSGYYGMGSGGGCSYISINNQYDNFVIGSSNILISAGGGAGSDYFADASTNAHNNVHKVYAGYTKFTQYSENTTLRRENDYFGTSVAVNKDYILIGAPNNTYDDDFNNTKNSGAVYAYYKNDDGKYKFSNRIIPQKQGITKFGSYLKRNKNDFLITTNHMDVYAYNIDINENKKFMTKFNGNITGNSMDYGCIVNENVVVFGSPNSSKNATSSTITSSGIHKNYIRDVNTNTWNNDNDYIVPGYSCGRYSGDNFGSRVAMGKTWLAISAPNHSYDENGYNNKDKMGAIYMYDLNENTGIFEYSKKVTDLNETKNGVNSLYTYGNFMLVSISEKNNIVYRKESKTDIRLEDKIAITNQYTSSVLINQNMLFIGDITKATGTNGQPTIIGTGRVLSYTRKNNKENFINTPEYDNTAPGFSNGRNAEDKFGYSVSIENSYVAIGSSDHGFDEMGNPISAKAGAVFIFNKDTNNKFNFEKKLLHPKNISSGIGENVITSGNYLFTNFYSRNIAGGIWHRNNIGVWDNQYNYTTGPNIGYAQRNSTVFVNNSHLVLGNPNGNGTLSGEPKIDKSGEFNSITRKGVIWKNDGYISIGGDTNTRNVDDYFGTSIASNKSYLLVGSPYHDYNKDGTASYTNNGAVYLYIKESNNNYKFIEKIVSPNIVSNAYFGYSVDINENNEIVIGSYGDNKAFIYKIENNTAIYKLTLSPIGNFSATDNFGKSVSINTNYIAVTSPNHKLDKDDKNSLNNAGAVYIWSIKYNNIEFVEKMIEVNREQDNLYGFSVSISKEDAIIIGSIGNKYDKDEKNSLKSSGAAWVHSLISKIPPSFITDTIPEGKYYLLYSEKIEIMSYDDIPFVLEITSGVLPKGIKLTQDGNIIGIPEEEGDFIFTIKATDSFGETSKEFTLRVT